VTPVAGSLTKKGLAKTLVANKIIPITINFFIRPPKATI
jgi:hypothetical protein